VPLAAARLVGLQRLVTPRATANSHRRGSRLPNHHADHKRREHPMHRAHKGKVEPTPPVLVTHRGRHKELCVGPLTTPEIGDMVHEPRRLTPVHDLVMRLACHGTPLKREPIKRAGVGEKRARHSRHVAVRVVGITGELLDHAARRDRNSRHSTAPGDCPQGRQGCADCQRNDYNHDQSELVSKLHREPDPATVECGDKSQAAAARRLSALSPC